MYPNGFRILHDAVFGKTPPTKILANYKKLFVEALWATVVWCVSLFAFNPGFRTGIIDCFAAIVSWKWVVILVVLALAIVFVVGCVTGFSLGTKERPQPQK